MPSYRKQILKDLFKFYEKHGPNNYALARTLSSFKVGNEVYVAALNQLLHEQLVIGLPLPPDAEGTREVSVAINPERFDDVRKELAAWYVDPKIIVPAIIAALALLWAILKFVVWRGI